MQGYINEDFKLEMKYVSIPHRYGITLLRMLSGILYGSSLQSQFLIGTVLLEMTKESTFLVKRSQFLIGTVLLLSLLEKQKDALNKVSIPHRYSITIKSFRKTKRCIK